MKQSQTGLLNVVLHQIAAVVAIVVTIKLFVNQTLTVGLLLITQNVQSVVFVLSDAVAMQ